MHAMALSGEGACITCEGLKEGWPSCAAGMWPCCRPMKQQEGRTPTAALGRWVGHGWTPGHSCGRPCSARTGSNGMHPIWSPQCPAMSASLAIRSHFWISKVCQKSTQHRKCRQLAAESFDPCSSAILQHSWQSLAHEAWAQHAGQCSQTCTKVARRSFAGARRRKHIETHICGTCLVLAALCSRAVLSGCRRLTALLG